MIDLDTVRLRARANLMAKRAKRLAFACGAISDPVDANDVAWGVRQVASLTRELQNDVDAIRPLYEAVRAEENGPSGVPPICALVYPGERP